MRRALALSVTLLFLPLEAWAFFQCTTTRSGSWSDPAAWSACNGGVPGTDDLAAVSPGHTLTYDINTLSGDTAATVWVMHGGTLRFPTGEHRMQLWGLDPFFIDGTLSVSNGTVIAFRSDGANPGFNMGNDSEFNSDGVSLGPLRRAESLKILPNAPQCGGIERWELGTSSSATSLVPGDLLQFASGAAQGRMFEVVYVAGSKISVCPQLPDGSSAGPRLTPHAPTSADFLPGAVPVQVPAVGDTFWAWHPWKVVQAGTAFWYLSEYNQPARENTGRFEWIGGDISGFGETVVGQGIFLNCGPGRPPVILEHNNFHEHGHGIFLISGFTTGTGCDRPNLTWNVIHDGTVPDGGFHLGVLRNGAGRVGGGVIAWNTFYRTAQNTIQVNAVGEAYPIEGFDVAYNTGFELGTSNYGECEFIETDVMSETVVQFNRAWKVSRACGGIIAKPTTAPSSFVNNLIRGNYVQGSHYGIDLSSLGLMYRDNVAVHNYLSESHAYGLRIWAAYANVVRRWAEGNVEEGSSNRYGMAAVLAEGNFLDGAGSARACQGINFADHGSPERTGLLRNNIIRGLSEEPGRIAGCIVVADSAEPHSANILHNVCDCDLLPDCHGVLIRYWFLPTSPVTVTVADNVVFDAQGNPSFDGAAARADSPDPNVQGILQNLTRWPLNALPAEGTWVETTGEVARDPYFVDPERDLNYLPQSSEPGAGLFPPGSSIGVMGATFDASLFPAFLRAVMVEPVDITNDPLTDDDTDGIPGDLDNCAGVPNATQEDDDADGWGNACDPCTDADADGFGSPPAALSTCPVDNCPDVANPAQSDLNGDGTGDECDTADGWILLSLDDPTIVNWQQESIFPNFNVYRGDLERLRTAGEYTQDPSVTPLAGRSCGVTGGSLADTASPAAGEAVYFLVTGVAGGVEGSLGTDGDGAERPNDHPCP